MYEISNSLRMGDRSIYNSIYILLKLQYIDGHYCIETVFFLFGDKLKVTI